MIFNLWLIPLSFFTILIILAIILALVTLVFVSQSPKLTLDSTPYECGVMPFSMSTLSTHIHFYVVSVVFLIFDVELVATLPVVTSSLLEKDWLSIWLLIPLILTLGLLLELHYGSLDWKC
uniref:NADH-ubiquinone oxidoreductase chain 3 n=2 Tax=Pediculus humanus TaxID=121225 RepID=B8Y964_PEDHC|nr:NADH dehydrogenase subunit 3 [Pediculus humanus corporis]AFO62991.1 NADH dehydrogenase subunit 3 [Pediculus humanus capitis]AHF70531.1 NADH dehydrogenase subunit 3 [Pediculus humanus corporis]AHF70532.1 NADH dehydrogenase subunit 3 [Pediculus humanus capitis]AHF70533.1 NADH dehydrogenase subunit 3 [Pediculus humanus corporis]